MEAMAYHGSRSKAIASSGWPRYSTMASQDVVEVLGMLVWRAHQGNQADDTLRADRATLVKHFGFEVSREVARRGVAQQESKQGCEILDQA